jgi:hypothetical protein
MLFVESIIFLCKWGMWSNDIHPTGGWKSTIQDQVPLALLCYDLRGVEIE